MGMEGVLIAPETLMRVWCRPATKLLPVLKLPDIELSPASMIITFDDDRNYDKDIIKVLCF